MTASQVVDKLMSEDHRDVLRESVAWVVAELMEARSRPRSAPSSASGPRASARASATAIARATGRRAGEVELAIPRLRTGSYFPSFLEPRKRSERALVAVVQEAYVNGVSTRKVDRLVEQLGVAGMSKDQVSRLCQDLDDQVAAFRERPLEGRHPYLWLDAKVERVREPGRGGSGPRRWGRCRRRPSPGRSRG
ncbi:MAG: transposase [Actinomycetota bacterium]|nr:transposase [Actinomycetota bacterium]